MIGFAKKFCVVGGDQIHQFLDFVRTLRGLKNGAVIVVRLQAQHTEAFLQAVRQQRLLVRPQPDAAVLVDQVNENPIRLAGKGHRHKKRPIDCCPTGALDSEVSEIAVVRSVFHEGISGHRNRATRRDGWSYLREEPLRRHRSRAQGSGLSVHEQTQFRH